VAGLHNQSPVSDDGMSPLTGLDISGERKTWHATFRRVRSPIQI
jgi:hypothetical protein